MQGPNRVCLWKRIRKGCNTFYHFFNFKVGDDSSIKFWHDPWCGGLPLKDNFPELYGFACNRDASVADLLSLLEDSYHWNVSFVKPAQDWELELVASFIDLIYSGLRRKNVVDELCWIPPSKQTFDVRSFYRAVHSSIQLSLPWKSIWKPKVPTKVSFFLWIVALGRI